MDRRARLERRKKRLTQKITTLDNIDLDRGRTLPERKWLRARIYRVDLLLEREGVL